MESKVKLFGHPIHPMLVVFPLGLLATAVIFDILFLIFKTPVLPTVSFYMIAAGIVGGLLAAVFGFLEWLGMPRGSRARTVGAWHGLGNFTIVVLFAISWLLRLGGISYIPSAFALVLSFVATGMALITAWLGGEMVYRLRVGVDKDANLNASNSLSSEPARDQNMRQPSR